MITKTLGGIVCASLLITPVFAQAPKTWTTAEDHQQMMSQLGIRKLRPGPSGTPSAPNQANYDESKANPSPVLPDALVIARKKCPGSTSACSTARLRGGSTTAATRTLRTGSISFRGPTEFSHGTRSKMRPTYGSTI